MESTAAVLHETSHDLLGDQPASIETVEVAEPTDEEVLVEIAAASLCHTDVSSTVGDNPEPLPVVLGHEGAGVVRAVGEAVTDVEPGDHVVLGRIACGRCARCRVGRSNLCLTRRSSRGRLRTGHRRFAGPDGTPYHHYHGVSSFTEFTNVTQEVAIPITEEVPLEQATLLGCGIFTGVGAVANAANVEPGASVAVFGAGGVGLSAVQGARLRGAGEIIVVDVVPEKFETARALGATHTIDAGDRDPVEAIHEITTEGADYTFEMVGHPGVVEQAIAALAPTGTAVLVGTPPRQPGDADNLFDLSVNLGDIVRHEKRIIGSFNGSYNLPVAIPVLAELVAAGRLSLDEMITSVRPLEELNEAMHDLETGPQIRQVIVP